MTNLTCTHPCDCFCLCRDMTDRLMRVCDPVCPAAAQFDRDCITAADDAEDIASRGSLS